MPKRIDANWRALPAPGCSSSEESSSLSEPTTDHSSSSGRTREVRPVGWFWRGAAAAGDSVDGRRWKGFVDCAADGEAAAEPAWASLRKGFLVSASEAGEVMGRVVFVAALGTGGTTVGTGGGGGETSFLSNSWLLTVGVEA